MPPKKTPDQTPAENLRGMLRGLMRLLLWVVPIVGIVYLIGSFFFSSDANTSSRPEEMLDQYKAFVTPYATVGGPRPGVIELDKWLDFFDSDSRKFFDENYARIVQKYNSGTIDSQVGELKDNVRIEAMRFLVRTPPLNGQFVITKQTPRADSPYVDVELATSSQVFKMVLKRELNHWRMMSLGGLANSIVKTAPSK